MEKFSIYLYMKLSDCPKNQELKVILVNILDEKFKLRLYEIGFYQGSKIKVLKTSALKQTLLVKVLDSCFALKLDIAQNIEVDYD